jgi:hypothetical protein
MGFDEPCFQDDDLSLARQAFEVDFDELRRVGWLKLPVPEAPFAEGRFFTPAARPAPARPACRCPTMCPTTRAPSATRRWRSATRWP